MKINRRLYIKALGYYICNAEEVVDEILESDDWGNVILREPFENWEINNIDFLVETLYSDFITVKKNS